MERSLALCFPCVFFCLCTSSVVRIPQDEVWHVTGPIPRKSSGKGHGLDLHLLSAAAVFLVCVPVKAEWGSFCWSADPSCEVMIDRFSVHVRRFKNLPLLASTGGGWYFSPLILICRSKLLLELFLCGGKTKSYLQARQNLHQLLRSFF